MTWVFSVGNNRIELFNVRKAFLFPCFVYLFPPDWVIQKCVWQSHFPSSCSSSRCIHQNLLETWWKISSSTRNLFPIRREKNFAYFSPQKFLNLSLFIQVFCCQSTLPMPNRLMFIQRYVLYKNGFVLKQSICSCTANGNSDIILILL